ncbi:uncharacterized protein K02A2.6-like [Saccostrea cucullata]|uniref:uncharacterized protein K02A2.6-like n=1 Tax=Saccostrea cuccullata TaxID=36930 RepID=UPI002ED31C02
MSSEPSDFTEYIRYLYGMEDQVAAPASIMQSHIPLPPKLELAGNVAQHWKSWKQLWDSYVIVTGLSEKTNAYQVATFVTCIGPEGLEVYNGLPFKDENEKNDPATILKLMEEYCVGKTNTIYERYVFNNKHQETGETIDSYVTKLRKLSLTCEFGQAAEKTAAQVKTMNPQEKIHTLKKSTKHRNGVKQKDHKGRGTHHKPQSTRTHTCCYCGQQHSRDKQSCPAWGKTCGKKNHFKAVCRQRDKRVNFLDKYEQCYSDEEILTVEQIFATSALEHPRKLFAQMNINSQPKPVKFQIDCGATCNVITDDLVPKNVKIQKGHHTLKFYNGQQMKTSGSCNLTLTNPRNGETFKENFVVVNSGLHPILGSSTSQQMNLISVQLDNIMTIEFPSTNNHLDMDTITKNYGDIFTGNGCFKGPVHLEIDETVPPVKLPLRRVPVAIKPLLQQELKRLEGLQVIQAVNKPTDWVSSLLAFKKANGKLRICIDPKPLNKALRRSHYPLPVIEDVLPDVSKPRVFTVCDVKNGFWHVELDEQSSYLTTFETPFGRYRWRRLPFGISPAPEIFQHRLELAIQNLPGVKAVADDILIYGEGDSDAEAVRDHDQKLISLLNRCREQGIKLNKDKFKLRLKEMPYIGHVLTPSGLKPDPRKVQAIIRLWESFINHILELKDAFVGLESVCTGRT